MLKRDITYTDYSDEPKEVTETFYFNLSPIEVVGMEAEHKEGLEKYFEGIVKEENKKEMFEMFKDLVLMAYGERSEDRKHFNKSPEIQKAFSESAAYQQLCIELMTSERALGEFVLGALPKNMANSEEARRILSGASLEVVQQPPLQTPTQTATLPNEG